MTVASDLVSTWLDIGTEFLEGASNKMRAEEYGSVNQSPKQPYAKAVQGY